MSSVGVLADPLLVVSCSATTTYLCWLCRSPLPDKEGYFVCLLTMAFLPVTVCVLSLSLSIPHCMHLVVQTHPYFFWVACHPSRTFPPKEPEKEHQNRFFSLSPPLDHALSYLWPMTHHFLYWLGTSWWCLGLARASPSSLTAHAFTVIWRLVCTFCRALLASYGMSCFSICHSLWLASFWGLGLVG